MKSILGSLLVWVLVFASPLRAEDSAPLAGDRARAEEVWRTFETWLAAYARADLEQVMSIFASDVVFSYQDSPDLGASELRASYIEDFKSRSGTARWVPAVEEVYADGDLGFVRATWELQIQPASGGAAEVRARNRSLDVLRRDGSKWVIFRSTNYPEKQQAGPGAAGSA